MSGEASSSGQANGGGIHAVNGRDRKGLINSAKRVETLWSEWESKGDVQDGHLPRPKIRDFLMALQMSGEEADNAMQPMVGQGEEVGLTLEQVVALCSAAEEEEEPPSPATSSAVAGSTSSPSKAPFKKILSKNRDYLGTGHLVYDEAVLAYIRKLEEHRRKCEAEGRYGEAKAAAGRLADLKTAQV